MSRFFSSPAFQALNQATGTSPVLIVAFNFGVGTYFYATRTIKLDDRLIKGYIVAVGDLVNEKRDDNFGSTGNCDITIQDVDGEIHNFISTNQLEGSPCSVFLGFEGMSLNDMILFLRGKIASPVTWDEGSRNFRFNIESHINDQEIGIIATKLDISRIAPEAEGVPWPLIFGTCGHVPALQIQKHLSAFLKAPIRLKSSIYKLHTSQIQGQNVTKLILHNDDVEVWTETTQERNIIYIRGAENFPHDDVIQINIDDVIFEGKFDSDPEKLDRFKVHRAHIPKYTNVEVDSRGELVKDASILKIKKPEIGLVDHHCYFRSPPGKEWYNYCIAQQGAVCIFRYEFRNPSDQNKIIDDMGSGKVIERVYKVQESGLTGEWHAKIIQLSLALANGKDAVIINALESMRNNKNSFWGRPAETEVRIWNVEDPDIYIISGVPCDKIHGVYAYRRRTPTERENDIEKKLMPISKEWYVITLKDQAYVDLGFGEVTTLKFLIPFKDRNKFQEWEEQIYVTAKSSIGPNTAKILEYILERWSTLSTDSSFSQVATQIESIPSHFALFDRGNTLEVAREIAWQARCVLRINSDVVGMRFLAAQPPALSLFNADSIELKSIQFSFTDTAEIFTRLIATWNETYRYVPALTRHNQSETAKIRDIVNVLSGHITDRHNEASKITVFVNNVDKYGMRSKDVHIFIYNEEQYIQKTLEFWGTRFSNSWRYVEFKTFLNGILLQTFDGVSFSVPNLITPILGEVEKMRLNYDDKSVSVRLWLPAVTGTATPHEDAWPGA